MPNKRKPRIDVDARFREAVRHYWTARSQQKKKQEEHGQIDAGTRGAVTGGTQMGALEVLIADILVEAGLDQADVRTKTALELPGYYRPEKKWDLVVVSGGQLVCAVELKSQVGPSFGNNFNNRVEEAIGSSTDVWTAYREGRFGTQLRPFLGFFFLVEDCAQVRTPVRAVEPHFPIDPMFRNASYAKRYELCLRRLALERLYDSTCLALCPKDDHTKLSHPAEDLVFRRFVAALQGHAHTFLASRPPPSGEAVKHA